MAAPRPGPPYLPPGPLPGGIPSTRVDVPVCAVLMAGYLAAAVAHMALFRRNLARGRKFVPSAIAFGFCMSRIATTALRIAWAAVGGSTAHHVSLAIAAQVLVYAGVVLLFALNLLFALRLLQAASSSVSPRLLQRLFRLLVVLLVLAIVMVIVVVVQSFYSLNPHVHRVDRAVELAALTFFAVLAFLPLPLAVLALLLLRASHSGPDASSERPVSSEHVSSPTDALVVLLAAVLLCLGASFRCAAAWLAHPSLRQLLFPPPSPWYDSKPAFYCFNFAVDIFVVYLFLLARVDRRFYLPPSDQQQQPQQRSPAGADEPDPGQSASAKHAPLVTQAV